jgi:HEAT repeat protein
MALAALLQPVSCKRGGGEHPAPTSGQQAASSVPGVTEPIAAPLVDRLLRTAAGEIDNQDQLAGTLAAIAALGPAAVAPLKGALADPDGTVRLAAVQALRRIGGARVIDPLIGALRDQDWKVREQAVEALGALKDRRATKPLLEQSVKDQQPQIRYECLTSLGLIGDPAAVPALVKGTHDHDRYVRMWAMDALCQMHDAHAPALALTLLHDPIGYVVRQTMTSCAWALDVPAGHHALIAIALSSNSIATAGVAQRTLVAYLKRPAGAAKLIEAMRQAGREALHGPHARNAALLLGDAKDPQAVDGLIAALADPSPLIRTQAAYHLGVIGDRRAVPALVNALTNHNPPLVAAMAYNSLQWFAKDGDSRAQAAVKGYKGQKFTAPIPR